jgi:hypothetical protein
VKVDHLLASIVSANFTLGKQGIGNWWNGGMGIGGSGDQATLAPAAHLHLLQVQVSAGVR